MAQRPGRGGGTSPPPLDFLGGLALAAMFGLSASILAFGITLHVRAKWAVEHDTADGATGTWMRAFIPLYVGIGFAAVWWVVELIDSARSYWEYAATSGAFHSAGGENVDERAYSMLNMVAMLIFAAPLALSVCSVAPLLDKYPGASLGWVTGPIIFEAGVAMLAVVSGCASRLAPELRAARTRRGGGARLADEPLGTA